MLKRQESETSDCAVSIVVPTYHRDLELARLLELLVMQDYPHDGYEIVVVDDACSPSTRPIVERIARAHADISLRLLPGRASGPAIARNLGWRAARGAIIAFIDDDAYPADAGWLRAGCLPFADAGVAAVSGKVVVPAISGRPTDFQRNVQQLEGAPFLTCNAFYRRDALAAVGGFDERFRVPFREDSDLYFRVAAQGARTLSTDAAVVLHPAPPGTFGVSLRMQRYSMYNALLYKKHRRRYLTEIQPRPPLHYYAMLGALLAALLAALRGRRTWARLTLALWAALDARFFLRRARGSSHAPRHLLDLALSSVLIPPLAVYWRLRGALRFRVLFL